MANWVFTGLRTGIKSSVYPTRIDETLGVSPGRPRGTFLRSQHEADVLIARCPEGAITRHESGVAVDHSRCVHCYRCQSDADVPGAAWDEDYEWGVHPDRAAAARSKLDRAFGRSLHIRFIDAGACGACMSEARQLNNPYYNMHRLGFFITPTPRNADILLVAGPVSDGMRLPLCKSYEAMPTPKRVVAIGVCAISGGVFAPSFACGSVAEHVPVDVVVPGCPPPPLAILHGLLLVVERKPPSRLVSPPTRVEASSA
jgi:Ni,Fe-hydrogenase III small subunit